MRKSSQPSHAICDIKKYIVLEEEEQKNAAGSQIRYTLKDRTKRDDNIFDYLSEDHKDLIKNSAEQSTELEEVQGNDEILISDSDEDGDVECPRTTAKSV